MSEEMRKRHPRLNSYNPIVIGNFYAKASVLGEQIIILAQNARTLKIQCRMFLNESDAVQWLEQISTVH